MLETYSEMIQDTAYNLEIRLQRVEESLFNDSTSAEATIDLQDEREMTRQCLRICQDAQSYLKSLQDGQASQRAETTSSSSLTSNVQVQSLFDAEVMTIQAINESRRKFLETINQLQDRLASATSTQGAEREKQMSQLREDINISKQCLEVCQTATAQVHHHRKILTVGEVIADDDTDQVVVTTLADLFDVRKVLAKSRSSQLVGSMTEETLQQVSRDRYRSRFGSASGDLGPVQTGTPSPSSNSGFRESSRRRPSPNEARKRATDGESGV